MIMLKDSNDTATRAAAEKLIRELAADPANGIDHILDRREIAALGGSSAPEFVVDMRPGFTLGTAFDGPIVQTIKPGGGHGYAPAHREMLASFFFAGPGVRAGLDVGEIDMRSIAPTIAKFLGAQLPTADLPPLALR